ncbi:MAG: hypothetical protein CMB16_02255 [Euryarchaeota archaeon]|nr:hypothetical protein [Euryarchaeota archaeon]
MPGTPYLEKPPDGLLTWPKLLKILIPCLSIILIVAWWKGFLLESGIVILILLYVSFLIRR